VDLRIFTEPQEGATYDDLLAVARTAEREGFGAFFRSDHYLRIGQGDPGPGSTDAWATLAALARETERIRLGTLVSPATFRLPGPLAITVAQVDNMSGGRVELGLGTGWFDREHTAYGIPFPPLGERFDRLEEQLAIVTGLWTTPAGKTFSHKGRHYQLTDSPALPKPVQSPRPPIIIGGGGKNRTPALVAEYADEYNVLFCGPEDARSRRDRARQACEAIDRDPDSVLHSVAVTVCCGADEAEVARRAEAIGRTPGSWSDSELGGTPAEVIDRLGQYAEAGIERAYLQVLDLSDLDHISLLAAEVKPHV
jgi:F420-dependent oxidoreductase-like protein